MNSLIELAPCPFCGGKAALSTVARDWYRIAADHCEGCPLEEFELDCPQTDEQLPLLLRDWNMRTPNDQLKAECEGLRKAGFADAFYKVAEAVGVSGARAQSPLEVFESEILPALKAAVVDAGRWRFVRNPTATGSPFAVWSERTNLFLGKFADEAIDAAMSKESVNSFGSEEGSKTDESQAQQGSACGSEQS